ncbi:hypothetical protein [Terrabacter sp. Root181]|uniref:hypothetical protein n=1 Tax=Terrabacter sp. Root181 TaxID=1736484 RepID=UPI0006F22DF6|nr:hypothetical protein [Terrabacter sp. Root181]KRB44270.1 hypothetical protein ASD90_17920 [Terrabacter sp. Root181]
MTATLTPRAAAAIVLYSLAHGDQPEDVPFSPTTNVCRTKLWLHFRDAVTAHGIGRGLFNRAVREIAETSSVVTVKTRSARRVTVSLSSATSPKRAASYRDLLLDEGLDDPAAALALLGLSTGEEIPEDLLVIPVSAYADCEIADEKRCARCELTLDVSAFAVRADRHNDDREDEARDSYCRPCRAAKNSEVAATRLAARRHAYRPGVRSRVVKTGAELLREAEERAARKAERDALKARRDATRAAEAARAKAVRTTGTYVPIAAPHTPPSEWRPVPVTPRGRYVRLDRNGPQVWVSAADYADLLDVGAILPDPEPYALPLAAPIL